MKVMGTKISKIFNFFMALLNTVRLFKGDHSGVGGVLLASVGY
jgi:hypothetical protein